MNRFTEDKVDRFNKEARSLIDDLYDAFNEGIMLPINELTESLVIEYKNYKRKCFFVKFLILIICGMIIYFHVWG